MPEVQHETDTAHSLPVGVVVIGRNEGERLPRCLTSTEGVQARVYVDSGSTDGSVERARALGIEVVELDSSEPFTAARARNLGLDRLRALQPGIELVQFLDGDTELEPGWLAHASDMFPRQDSLGAVAGTLRERHPEASIYNRLAALEWRQEPGPTTATGGNAMMRIPAVLEVGGFRSDMIAGEEPELCLRLRQQGWQVLRSPEPMAIHDADMTSMRQWFKRSVRSGHAYAESRWIHRDGPDRYRVRETRSSWFWGLCVPVLALAGIPLTEGLSLALLGGYALLFWRVYSAATKRGFSRAEARLYAASCTLGKFPEMLGQCLFHLDRLRGQRRGALEHRSRMVS